MKKRSKSETLPEPMSTPGTALSSSSGSAFRPNLSKPIPTTTSPESPTKGIINLTFLQIKDEHRVLTLFQQQQIQKLKSYNT